MPPQITINFDSDFPSENLAGQAFNLIALPEAAQPTQSGVDRGKGGEYPVWLIGRHPKWCDFVAEPECRALSVIHMTIAYKRDLDVWMILDGGVYPEPISYRGKRDDKHPELSKSPGYAPSSYGVWLNEYRLPAKNLEPIEPSDRVLLNDAFKIIFTKDLYTTIGPEAWSGRWKPDQTSERTVEIADIEKSIESDLRKQSSKSQQQITWPMIADRVLNGPPGVDSRIWWGLLVVLVAGGFWIWASM